MKTIFPRLFSIPSVRRCGGAMAMAAVLATQSSRAQSYGSAVVSDLANPFNALSFDNPNDGFGQQITITSGVWSITQAQINLGMQDPVFPVTPVMQLRDASGPGGGPGATLGSFSIDPNSIPPWMFGVNNFGTVTAPVVSNFVLGPGTYWLCVMNDSAEGGFMNGYATVDPLVQTGVAGTVPLQNEVALTTDGGNSFNPANFGGYAMLVELDAQPVPEPATGSLLALAGLGALAPVLRRRVRG